jgi:acetyl esterase/lipase
MRRIADLPYSPVHPRCTADLYLPAATEVDALLWLHGGGMVEGDKGGPLPPILVPDGFALCMANYRLLQHAPFPACIEDAAAAWRWLPDGLAAQGVRPRRLFIGGESAGAYLAAMVGLDPARQTGARRPDGVIPLSGQMTSHFAYRPSIGLRANQPVIDAYAPLWHVRADAPQLLLIVGSDDIPCRPEENAYMAAAMRENGHAATRLHVIPGRTHATIGMGRQDADDPVTRLIHGFLLGG